MLGRKHTPEAIANITAKRRARKVLTDTEIAEECRLRNLAKASAVTTARLERWKLDMLNAHRLGLTELFHDVKQSSGLANHRRIQSTDPRVSNGWCHRKKIFLWPVQLPTSSE